MGLLTIGEPLEWSEIKQNSVNVRCKGIEQFIQLYKTFQDRDLDSFKYGDEVEYSLVKFDHKEKKVFCLLKAQTVLNSLARQSKLDNNKIETLWSPEFANFMIEGLPARPYEHDINCIKLIEENMKLRRRQAQSQLDFNEYVMTFSTFPLIGCPDFTWPQCETNPGQGITSSMFLPDSAVFQGHPRYAASMINNRKRRRAKHGIKTFFLFTISLILEYLFKLIFKGTNIPIYKDKNTPAPFRDNFEKYSIHDKNINSQVDHIYIDGIGASCSCLQVTFQAKNVNEARHLYDQLTPLTPLLLALSASSPIWRGYLTDIDCRWKVISESLDDRTPEEKGEQPLSNDDQFRIHKSRYDSIDCYLSELGSQFNDIQIVKDKIFYEMLIQNGVDDLMAQHIAHLFIRDPLVLYRENLYREGANDGEGETDLWENIQSTNWQSMRFKPPPNMNKNAPIGWRVEFRTTELQITDFENSAFVTFLMLLTRMILSFNLNLLIPISKVDENMQRAQKRDACIVEKFYFRINLFDQSKTDYEEMSTNEIMNGKPESSFPGLVPLIKDYLSQLDSIDFETNCKIMQYLKLIEKKASGELKTTANWMRTFVQSHPKYNFDSVVNNEIAYDLMWTLNKITQGLISATDLNDSFF
jgi:glutamate--cysteine ligase catalytic subunit